MTLPLTRATDLAPPEASPVDYETFGTIYEPRGPARAAVTGAEAYPLRSRITAGGRHAPQPGRFHLFVSLACPFAHRTLIVHRLKGLADVVGISVLDPLRDGRGWAFRSGSRQTLDQTGRGFAFLQQAYDASVEGGPYTGRVSVPALWDNELGEVVSNYFPTITLDLGSAFDEWADHPEVNLYPDHLRAEIDALDALIGPGINHGVYRAGFATSQAEYEAGFDAVFTTLDLLEDRLADGGPYLLGAQLTEADIRLWVTLVRFDAVYHGHFKVNRRRLVDYPALWLYARRLYAIPAFRTTTSFDHIKRHYYGTQRHLNPRGVVPAGPATDWEL